MKSRSCDCHLGILDLEFEKFVMTQTICSSQTTLCGKSRGSVERNSNLAMRIKSSNEQGGYALVALLVVMSLLALFAMAAASSVTQQAQREREKEAIFRGEQVADAIRLYYRSRVSQGANSLPTNMEQLLACIQIPRRTNKLQIL